jgi:hypothetical protein
MIIIQKNTTHVAYLCNNKGPSANILHRPDESGIYLSVDDSTFGYNLLHIQRILIYRLIKVKQTVVVACKSRDVPIEATTAVAYVRLRRRHDIRGISYSPTEFEICPLVGARPSGYGFIWLLNRCPCTPSCCSAYVDTYSSPNDPQYSFSYILIVHINHIYCPCYISIDVNKWKARLWQLVSRPWRRRTSKFYLLQLTWIIANERPGIIHWCMIGCIILLIIFCIST